MISTHVPPPVHEVPDLLPARMLNEFAYCPRLAYLEWVQGEFADNLDVLEGRFGHRRVDTPDRGELPVPDPAADASAGGQPEAAVDVIHSRSVMLSAPVEGLIAKLDLIELSGSEAIPVDYKKGKMPDIPGNAWEPERVQLCAQGLILRECGYHCDGGIIYYIQSRRRVSVAFDEELVERTRQLARDFRSAAAAAILPEPLVDSPKCPRCSLVGICLPDETRLCEHPDQEGEIRRLIPARDDRLPLYVQEQGVTLGKSSERITVKQGGQILQEVKLIDLSQVSIFGNVQLTAQALRELTTAGIPICHFSYGGWFHALTSGLLHKNVELRIAQFRLADDPARSLALARQFVVGKIRNCRTLLRRNRDDADQPLDELNELAQKAAEADSAATLLGLEGMAARHYFAGFARLLDGGEAFDIDGRNRRPPRDPVNAMLSFVYSMLVKELTLVLHAVGFDPLRGFYHCPRYGRPALALDLAEPFRPLLADSAVLTLVNNGEVAPEHFLNRGGAVAMTDAGRRAVIAAFERRLDTLVRHPLFGYQISYRRVLEVQARLLSRTVLGELAEYPNFCTR